MKVIEGGKISIKEVVGDVSIEWIFDTQSNDVVKIEKVGYNASAEVVEILETPQNVYRAFCVMNGDA
jgi:hypothetical protein